jgi:hypothetical protein
MIEILELLLTFGVFGSLEGILVELLIGILLLVLVILGFVQEGRK